MKKLFSGIKWFEDTLTSAFLSIVVLITLANVVARYVMKSSIPWAQEISGFFWTWTVMIGMSVGYRRNLHYGVDFLVAKLPKKYAIVLKRQYGKTEMWYVMEAAPDAYLYYGLKESVTKGELSKSITDGTIIDLLRAVPVHAGDLFFIPAGTIHAICRGTVIAEIQQNSNVTYRVFDYNRIGKDGKKRQLHVQQALDVVNLNPTPLKWDFGPHLATCPYFTVDKVVGPARGICSEESFVSILIVKGQGTVSCAGECAPAKQGDSFVLPAGSGGWAIDGNCEALVTQLE